MKNKLGMILRDNLENLIKEDDDYCFLNDLSKNWGGHHNLDVNSDYSNVDAIFFLNYPYDEALANKLSANEHKVPFINKPSGVLKTSEKTFEYNVFKDVAPATELISKNHSYDDLLNFSNQFEGVVIKPINGTGGKGIYFLDKPYREEDILKLKQLGDQNSEKFLVQEYLKNQGDARILCYNGKVIGSFGRQGNATKLNNISAGGKIIDFKLEQQDVDLSEYVADTLKKMGVFYIGLDVINHKLIEVNTAMPGGVSIMSQYNLKSQQELSNFLKEETKQIIKEYK